MNASAQAGPQAAWVLPKKQLEEWLKQAPIGARLIYCHAPEPIYGETWDHVKKLAAERRVHPANPRSETCEGFRAFTVVVLRLEAEPEKGKRRTGEDADPAMQTILAQIRRAANFGRKCQTNPELARAAGLSTAAQVAWRLTKLTEAGHFRLATVKDGPEAGWRTAIFPDGKQTLAAPSARAIAETIPQDAGDQTR